MLDDCSLEYGASVHDAAEPAEDWESAPDKLAVVGQVRLPVADVFKSEFFLRVVKRTGQMLKGDAFGRIQIDDLDRGVGGEERLGLEFDG